MKDKNIKTPSQFYRNLRPENFSDSVPAYEVILPKEQLAYELLTITTNQKQDQFENLCRRMAEKLIVPNLIPQVGPTGGGDGKTDTETHSVSSFVSERWFVPDNGWNKDENWAFAISAKEDWKPKVRSDVQKIVETGRGYTKIYFFTNQLPSSKQKKEMQDELAQKWNVPLTILDGAWLLEKIYENDFIELVVDSLSLSSVYKNKKDNVGVNDVERIERLQELENSIANPQRYFEYDPQLVEDALESAIVARKLEKPKWEVEGRFRRALSFCEKIKNKRQLVRIHYQLAWTYLNYYDDYSAFITEVNHFKHAVNKEPVLSELELYSTLYHLFEAITHNGFLEGTDLSIDIDNERRDFLSFIDYFLQDESKPSAVRIAQTYQSLLFLEECLHQERNPNDHIKKLVSLFKEAAGFIEYPFEHFQEILENYGQLLSGNTNFDTLINTIAEVSAKRHSELSSAHIYMKRGGQKLNANLNKDSIVYFGKAVLKLAKEESQNIMALALEGIGHAYRRMDLYWASNNSFITACAIRFKSWFQNGVVDPVVIRSICEMVKNEFFLGRVPNFLLWHQLFALLKNYVHDDVSENEDINQNLLFDISLGIRLLHASLSPGYSFLPPILVQAELPLSEDAVLYKLGYIELLLKQERQMGPKTEDELNDFYSKVANQPLVNQMIGVTNLVYGDDFCITTKILGCEIYLKCQKNKELILSSEAILAYLEAFLATSLQGLLPTSESITINLIKDPHERLISYTAGLRSNEYEVRLSQFDFPLDRREQAGEKLMEFIGHLIARNFVFQDLTGHLENLYRNEEVTERLALIWEHRKFFTNVHGLNPKIILEDWIVTDAARFPNKRKEPILFSTALTDRPLTKEELSDIDEIPHGERLAKSIIDVHTWSDAMWKAFGYAQLPNNLGIMIGFENGNAGRKIFEDWIYRFGHEDVDEVIRISLIRGIYEDDLKSYRVHITTNILEEERRPGTLLSTVSQIHEMNPSTTSNLDNIVNGLARYKRYILFPARVNEQKNIEPYINYGILKSVLHLRWAWEIGEHDPDSPGIKRSDKPFIPPDITNAPVIQLLKRKSQQEEIDV